jgi:GT2 family glycosyltransferase
MDKIKIDIGIVTYNRMKYLKDVLDALNKIDDDIIFNIFIFDNGSSDQTSTLFNKSMHKVVYFNNNENIGSAGGFAECMKFLLTSQSDWIWLFNDDSYPNEDSISLLKSAIENFNFNKVGMIKVSREIDGMSEIIHWNGVGYGKLIPISNTLIKSDLVTFDGTLISKELIQTIGTCNPSFFMGTYEYDFCLRAKDAGFDIYTLPNGTIIDLKLGSKGGVPIWRTYYNTRNHLYLVTRRKSLRGVFQWIKKEMKIFYGIIFYKENKLKRVQIKFLAIYHGLFGKLGKRINPSDSYWN